MPNSIYDNLNEEFISGIKQKHGKRFEKIAKHRPSFGDEQAMKLGILLENVEREFSRIPIFESTQTANVRDGLKNQYFDIISVAWPDMIAEDLVSVQPLQQKMAQIFWMQYEYGTNKGQIKKGDVIFGPHGNMAGYENSDYTSEYVPDEQVFRQEDGGTVKVFGGSLDFVPIHPGTIRLVMDDGDIAYDNARGSFVGQGVSGTIDYETGAFEVTFAAAPAAGECYAFYEYDLAYAPSTIPEIDVKVVDSIIQARPRKLKGTYSLDAGYDLKMSQGIDINDAILEAASNTLRHETDGDLIRMMFTKAAHTTTWDASYKAQAAFQNRMDFYLDFIDNLVKASSTVRFKTKRVEANWIVVGKMASDILAFIGAPRFVAANTANAVGPHLAGTLDNKWRIYVDPFLADNEYLLGYKGNAMIDAGMIYAPYLAFFATETIMLDDFLGRRGFATSYGKKMVNPDLYVRGIITDNSSAIKNPWQQP